MNRKQIFAIISPIIVILVMYQIFQLLSMAFHNNWRIGWFLGLMIYWLLFGNGFFEEILWRGVYMKLFPNNLLLRIVWPSIWFGLWHYVPGSINPNSSHVLSLIIGALFLGFYSSFLAKKTNTLWWSIVTHVLGGIIMVG